MATGYQRAEREGERSKAEEALERYVREGARQMLAVALADVKRRSGSSAGSGLVETGCIASSRLAI